MDNYQGSFFQFFFLCVTDRNAVHMDAPGNGQFLSGPTVPSPSEIIG